MPPRRDVVAEFTDLVCKQNVAVPVAAMNALVMTIADSDAKTWMELKDELDTTILRLNRCGHDNLGGRTNLSLRSGCDLFMRYVTRAFDMDSENFATCRTELARRGKRFAGYSRSSRAYIADIGHSFVQDNCTVLVHGNSRVVAELLLKAAESKKFSIYITESRPNDRGTLSYEDGDEVGGARKDGSGSGSNASKSGGEYQSAVQYAAAGIPTTIILDCGIGAIMDQVDLCIVGAEGVMENGGIVNKVGTSTIAMVAKTLKKPFYVAVESYKFARMYPLTQRDITDAYRSDRGGVGVGVGVGGGGGGISLSSSGSGFGNAAGISTTGSSDEQQPIASDMGSAAAAIEATIPRHENLKFMHTTIDYTPAEFITLLFTDLGVLTPAAVSDELIKLYQ